MRDGKPSRRDVLKASTGLAAGTVFAGPLKAAAPEPTAITPTLIAAVAQGRQDCLLHGAGAPHRGKIWQSIRSEISRHHGAR